MVFTPSRSRVPRKGFAPKAVRRSFLQATAKQGDTGSRARLFRLSPAEERRVVQRARRGDAAAVRQLIDLLSGPVFRYGRGFCGQREDAEDVAQNVLLAMIRGLDRFRGDASLSTWAYTVARRACVRQRRKDTGANGKQRIAFPADPSDDRTPAIQDPRSNPARDLEQRDLRERLSQAIASLPPRSREVLVLRDVEGLPASRVAEILGIGERAVKSRLHRARSAVRQELGVLRELGAPPELGAGQERGARKQRGAPQPAGVRGAAGRHTPESHCPDTTGLLSRFLEGELDTSACATLETHVAACTSCQGACETLRSLLAGCRSWRKDAVPAKVKRQIQVALREWIEAR